MLPTIHSIKGAGVNHALRAMFAARKQVFVDGLGWDIPVLAGKYEIDQFDTEGASYLVLTDEDGNHRASARLLPTDSPHILADLFPQLSPQPIPVGSTIREITRFCIDPSLEKTERRLARNQLVTALVEHALERGIAAYTAVATNSWFRQISRFGWKCSALGPCLTLGGEALVAMKIEIDRDTPGALSPKGIYCSTSYDVAMFEGAA
ncbi:acyl-homoserine-lactone synthase [Erythrobacter aureus]|uniref:Acyl-homoserine-lactone synthase n=1 Tax=Erythrobacter aureus TaxID=2182384 RepID=A0A345YBL9_9SPHN|nr:acyl-homoserine-lactone synthase [Erythrobacter aureus]AXK41321.1 autoinducer synthase [Erythrobacter aureus]